MNKSTFKINPIRAAVIGATLLAANGAAMATTVSTSLEFICPFPLIGDQNIIAQISGDFPEIVDISKTNAVGPIHIDTVNIIPDKARQGLAFVDATTITGTATSYNSIHAVAEDLDLTTVLTIEPTTIPTDESGPFNVLADGDAPIVYVNESHVGPVSITVDDLVMDLRNLKADGSVAPAPVGEFIADCTLAEGQDNTLVTLEVVNGPGTTDEPADIHIVGEVAALDFGSMQLGQSATKTITITNAGDLDLGINAISISGTGAAAFTETNTCTTISGGSTCTIEVTYTASEAGAQSASLTIESTDQDEPLVSVALTATAQVELTPEIDVNVTSIDFGTIDAGTSKTETITITNTGGAALTVSGIDVTGSEFTKTSDTCSIIAAGSSCNTQINYTSVVGISSGTATITSDDEGDSSIAIPLSGTGKEIEEEKLIVHADLSVDGDTYIAASKATMPLSGNISADIDILSGNLTGDLLLNPTVGKFEVISGWSRYLATAQVEFEPVDSVEGTLIDGKLIATTSAYIKLPKVTKTLFGLVNWPIGGGKNCRTKEPVSFNITSVDGEHFEALLGGNVTGNYTLPKLENCGPLTSILNLKMAGPDNKISLSLVPSFD